VRKALIVDARQDVYSEEVQAAADRFEDDIPIVTVDNLTVEWLQENKIDVTLSANLSVQWCLILKGLGIVNIIFGRRSDYYELADIVIDFQTNDRRHYFATREFSFRENNDIPLGDITNLVKTLPWDSKFFGFDIAFLSCMHLTDNIWKKVKQKAKENNVRLIEYLCNCHDSRSVRVAENANFHFTDIRLTLHLQVSKVERPMLSLNEEFVSRKATERDIPVLRSVAAEAYTDSRYFFDKNFSPTRVKEFYSDWVEKGVRGTFDDECICLVGRHGAVAFCTIKYLAHSRAKIGLFGVDGAYVGQGLGKKLLGVVVTEMIAREIVTVEVVTQGRNFAAQRLYENVGFRIHETQLWYHKWV